MTDDTDLLQIRQNLFKKQLLEFNTLSNLAELIACVAIQDILRFRHRMHLHRKSIFILLETEVVQSNQVGDHRVEKQLKELVFTLLHRVLFLYTRDCLLGFQRFFVQPHNILRLLRVLSADHELQLLSLQAGAGNSRLALMVLNILQQGVVKGS